MVVSGAGAASGDGSFCDADRVWLSRHRRIYFSIAQYKQLHHFCQQDADHCFDDSDIHHSDRNLPTTEGAVMVQAEATATFTYNTHIGGYSCRS